MCFTATGFLSHETLMGDDDDDDDNDVKSNGDGRVNSRLEDVDNGKIMLSLMMMMIIMMMMMMQRRLDYCNNDDGVKFRMMMER